MKYLGTISNTTDLVDKAYVDAAVANAGGGTTQEAFLEWGGQSIANGVSPIDSAMLKEHSANRLAGFTGVTFHQTFNYALWGYDRYVASEEEIHKLLTGQQSIRFGYRLAGGAPSNSDEINLKLTFLNGEDVLPRLFCTTKKLLINFCSNGAKDCKLTIYKRTITNWYNGDNEYTQIGEYKIDGNSGWNSIPLSLNVGCWAAQQETSNNVESLVLRFSHGTAGSSPAEIRGIRLIAPTLFYSESEIAKTEHPYTYTQTGEMVANVGVTTPHLNFPNGISLRPITGGFRVYNGDTALFDVTSSGIRSV